MPMCQTEPCSFQNYGCEECRERTNRAFRGAAKEHYLANPNRALLTLIPQDGMIPYDEIGGFDLDLFKRRHHARLVRHLPKDCLFMGCVDVCLNSMENRILGWSFHFHGMLNRQLTTKEKERLKKAYPINKDVGIHKPVQVKGMDDYKPSHAVKYIYKHFFLKRSGYIAKPKSGREPYLDSRDIPLKSKEMKQLQTYLERYKVTDPILLIGLKRVRSSSITGMRFMRT